MERSWRKYFEAAGGATEVPRKRAEQLVKTLVKQGEMAADKAEKAVEDLVKRSESNRKAIVSLARSETERAVGKLGLARQKDVDKLQAQIERLEAQLAAQASKQTKAAGGARSPGGGSARSGRAAKPAAKRQTAAGGAGSRSRSKPASEQGQ